MFILITRSNIIFFTASLSSSHRDLPSKLPMEDDEKWEQVLLGNITEGMNRLAGLRFPMMEYSLFRPNQHLINKPPSEGTNKSKINLEIALQPATPIKTRWLLIRPTGSNAPTRVGSISPCSFFFFGELFSVDENRLFGRHGALDLIGRQSLSAWHELCGQPHQVPVRGADWRHRERQVPCLQCWWMTSFCLRLRWWLTCCYFFGHDAVTWSMLFYNCEPRQGYSFDETWERWYWHYRKYCAYVFGLKDIMAIDVKTLTYSTS